MFEMIRLEREYILYGLALVPVLVVLFTLMMYWRKRALGVFGEKGIVSRLLPDTSGARSVLKFVLLIVGFSLMLVGIANPQIGSKLEEVKRAGVDIIIALDVSNSMKAEDIRPNRLSRSKRAISRLIDNLFNDRIGLIVFAGEAYLQLPLTSDYAAAKLFLSTVDTDVVSTQGTAIGAAIELAREAFESKETKHKAMIIITDGENHEDDAIGAASDAAGEGIVIHTIGMGSPGGVPIPNIVNGINRGGFRKDRDGNTIVTRLDESMLRQIAAAANGSYVRATTSDTGLDAVLDEINTMEKKEFGTRMFTDYEDRFQYFLGGALLLLLGEFFISGRRSRWLRKISIFNESKAS